MIRIKKITLIFIFATFTLAACGGIPKPKPNIDVTFESENVTPFTNEADKTFEKDFELPKLVIPTLPEYKSTKSDNTYIVTRIVDGDTIEITHNDTIEKVRLIGVNTPESVHPDKEKNTEFGKISSAFTEDYLLQKEVHLEFDVSERDKYGRLLAYVWINNDNIMLNEYLVENGYAQVSTIPPDVKYADRFQNAQTKARDAGLGLWSYNETLTTKTEHEITQHDQNENAIFVFITALGTKYHNEDCTYLTDTTAQMTLAIVKEKEYEPCSECEPPV